MKRLVIRVPISLFCLLLAFAFGGQAKGGWLQPSQHDPACPDQPLLAGRLADVNRNARAAIKTVPGGPNRALLCRYWGIYQGKDLPKVVERRFSRAALVRSLAKQFNHQPPSPYSRGTWACPTGGGGPIYAFFSYENLPVVVVEVWRDGCQHLSNGYAKARALTPRLERRLLHLLPLPERSQVDLSH